MKLKYLIVVSFFMSVSYNLKSQTPQKPTNPFPTNKPAPTPTPKTPSQTVPPVTSQQIPPSTQPKPTSTPTNSSTTPTNPQSSLPANSGTQTNPASKLLPITGTDEEQIIATVFRVFDAMRSQDSTIAKPLFAPNCRLFTPQVNNTGQVTLSEEPIGSFFRAISTKRKEKIDERILKYKIDIDGPLASVWADYNLYVDTNFIHCGVDVFQLYKSNEGWKIFELADTRRKTGCIKDPKDDISVMLNKWHRDAALANGDAYFGAFTHDGIFLGTDPKERWSVPEFKSFAKSAFDNKKAWDFKPSNRFVNISPDGQTAWFDEDLSTWMGPCRGSGVLVKSNNGWKIKQYNLTILVPNEKVQDYLKILNNK